MSLSMRVIAFPKDESVSSYNVSLPDEGGRIGRIQGCDLVLNDKSETVSDTHAIIQKSPQGYLVTDTSQSGLFINDSETPVGNGNQLPIKDGDVIRIADYRLLVSCFSPSKSTSSRNDFSNTTKLDAKFADDPFGDMQALVPKIRSNEQIQIGAQEFVPQQASGFQDVTPDPFSNQIEPKVKEKRSVSIEFSDEDDDPFYHGKVNAGRTTEQESSYQTESQVINDSHGLVDVSSHNQITMEKALELAFTRLLKDLSPSSMEEMFDELSPPSFWRRKPDHWQMYKKYFNRQEKNKDWHIKFSAYFQEALHLQLHLGKRR